MERYSNDSHMLIFGLQLVAMYPIGYITTSDLARVLTNHKKMIKRREESVKTEVVEV